jgi:putative DNA primase/helicase
MSRAFLQSWARALGGAVSGNGVVCPGPGHSAKDRSLSVTISATSPDVFLVFSHAGDDWAECRDYVRSRLGLPAFRRERAPMHDARRRAAEAQQSARDDAGRWVAFWKAAVHPHETLVQAHLRSRGLVMPHVAAKAAIRFHPACPFGPERFPAMVCLIRNIITDEPQGIHRTALGPDGIAIKRDGKTYRLSLGAVAGGAIKLDADEDVEQVLCVGEGVETCLAARQMGLRPVWSAVSTVGVTNFPVRPGIDGLHILKENDSNGASAKAVEACARRWYDAGRDVTLIDPDSDFKDLNDELMRRTVK